MWDELLPPLRAEDLVFKNYLLALQHEAAHLRPLWKLWPLASDLRSCEDTQGYLCEERDTNTL